MNPIVEKIQKLLRLAQSSNPHEAALAATRAQELMVKYAIDEAQLADRPNDPVEVEVIPLDGISKRIPNWLALLSHAIAPSFFCRSFYTPGERVVVVGRKTDREIHKATFNWLRYQLEAMAELAWQSVKEDANLHGKKWKNAFYHGACQIIHDRLTANVSKLLKGTTESQAIVLADKAKAVDDYIRDNHNIRKSNGKRSVDAGGYIAGMAAGAALDLGAKASKQIEGTV